MHKANGNFNGFLNDAHRKKKKLIYTFLCSFVVASHAASGEREEWVRKWVAGGVEVWAGGSLSSRALDPPPPSTPLTSLPSGSRSDPGHCTNQQGT